MIRSTCDMWWIKQRKSQPTFIFFWWNNGNNCGSILSFVFFPLHPHNSHFSVSHSTRYLISPLLIDIVIVIITIRDSFSFLTQILVKHKQWRQRSWTSKWGKERKKESLEIVYGNLKRRTGGMTFFSFFLHFSLTLALLFFFIFLLLVACRQRIRVVIGKVLFISIFNFLLTLWLFFLSTEKKKKDR